MCAVVITASLKHYLEYLNELLASVLLGKHLAKAKSTDIDQKVKVEN